MLHYYPSQVFAHSHHIKCCNINQIQYHPEAKFCYHVKEIPRPSVRPPIPPFPRPHPLPKPTIFPSFLSSRPRVNSTIKIEVSLLFYHIFYMKNIDEYLSSLESLAIIPEREVKAICQKAKEILSEQPNLVHVRAPVTVCGDTHGQFFDLLEIFQICGKLPHTNYLFMGDYVDRGFNSVETFLYILLLKIKHRSRITILRGNHENREINKLYGFYDECLRKYGTDLIWKMFADIFQCLPVAAEIENQIFCLHGGLSPEIETLDQLRNINRFQDVPHNGALCDLLWSDPADQGKTGFSSSPRGAGYCWGEDISEKFLRKNNLKTICRAHQLVMEGYSYAHKNKCVTVFSAPNYCYRCGNQAAALEFGDNLEVNYQKYDPSPKEKETEPTRRVPEYFL